VSGAPSQADGSEILQIKVWLERISPMVWRCVLMPALFSLQEFHGVTLQIRTHFCRQAEDSVRH
jgi:hypothetical protein